MKKKLMLALTLLLAAVLSAGCGRPAQVDSEREKYFKDDFPFAERTGNETEINVLFDSGLIEGVGYPDQELPKSKQRLLLPGALGDDGMMQYFFTKALYNYNIEKNGVRVKFENWGWGDSLLQKQTQAFTSKKLPNVMIGETQMPGYAREGLLEPFPDDLAARIREQCVPVAYQAMEIDGKIYGVSPFPSLPLLIWNKEILRQAGVEEKFVENGPATWEEFQRIAEQVKAMGRGKYTSGGIYCGDDLGGYLRSAPYLYMNGGGLMDEDGNPTFDLAENAEALELFRAIGAQTQRGLTATTEETAYSAFNRERLAFVVDGSWRIKLSQDNGIDVGYCRLPSPTGEEEDNVPMGATYYSVPKGAANVSKSFAVIESFIAHETQMMIAKYNKRPVVRKDIGESLEFQQMSPDQAAVFQYIKSDKMFSLPVFSQNNSAIYQKFGEALKKSVTTDEPIAELLRAAQEEAEKLLR